MTLQDACGVLLPVEMLQAIVQEIPATNVDELLALRLVNRTFRDVVKDKAFRYLRLQNSPIGARRLANFVQSSSKLVGAVEHIRMAQPETADDDDEENHIAATTVALPRRGNLAFPAVKSVEISLPSTAVAYQHIHLSLLFTVFKMVPSSVRSLTLTNWIPRHSDQYQGPYATNHLSLPLSSLKDLYIAVRSYEYKDRSHRPLSQPRYFWQRTLPNFILYPTQSTLTSLTLSTDMHSSLADLDLTTLFFPHLEALSLRGFLFSIGSFPPTDMEQFILRHKSTLKHLELHKCAILRVLDSFRSWEEVWLCFAAELDILRELVVDQYESGESVLYYEGDARCLRYTIIPASRQRPSLQADDGVDWDWKAEAEALEDLKTIVEFRFKLQLQ